MSNAIDIRGLGHGIGRNVRVNGRVFGRRTRVRATVRDSRHGREEVSSVGGNGHVGVLSVETNAIRRLLQIRAVLKSLLQESFREDLQEISVIRTINCRRP